MARPYPGPGRAARRTVTLLAFALLLGAPGSAGAAVKITDAEKLRRAVIERISTVRENKGLPPLASAPRLRKAANRHLRDMATAGYFEHHWSDGTPYGRWVRRFWPGPDYSSWSAGENLYLEAPRATAKNVVAAWMTSPPHRKNMLRRSWRWIGVAAVRLDNPEGEYAGLGTVYLVAAEFGARSK
jgi:uncharacterized protein YkwD